VGALITPALFSHPPPRPPGEEGEVCLKDLEGCFFFPLLASALLLHQEGLEITFACSDRGLLAAAASEGLATFDPVQGD
jgi:hypothetical protein